MGDYGFKVTKEGKSVTSTTVEDYIFSSAYSTVKIVKEYEGTLSMPAAPDPGSGVYGEGQLNLRHDLGFIPLVMVYFEATPGSGRWLFGCPFSTTEEILIDQSQTYVTNIRAFITFYNMVTSARTLKYHVYVFGDPI